VSAGLAAVPVDELAGLLAADPGTVVLDVREPGEYAAGHVPGALSIPLAIVPLRHLELPRTRTIHVVCETGGRSAQAVRWLQRQGYDAVDVPGGIAAWRGAGHPLEFASS
jgi:rhodanese-related sulfurtransferase